MFKRVLLLCLMFSLFGPATHQPGDGDATASAAVAQSHQVIIKLHGANGSACPDGTGLARAVQTGPDTFRVEYADFEASGGTSRNCLLTMRMKLSQDTTYALAAVTNTGTVDLGARSTGRSTVTSHFTGQTFTIVDRFDLDGPLQETWQAQTEIDDRGLRWAPCGAERYLNLNSVLRVTGPDTARMRLERTEFTLRLRSCP